MDNYLSLFFYTLNLQNKRFKLFCVQNHVLNLCSCAFNGSMAVDGKRLLESNASSIPGTYFRLGYAKVPKIEEAFDQGTFYRQLPLIPFNSKRFIVVQKLV